jgi:hypothetical protein
VEFFLFTPGDKQLEEKAFVAVESDLPDRTQPRLIWLEAGCWTLANHFPHGQAIQEYRQALTLNRGWTKPESTGAGL